MKQETQPAILPEFTPVLAENEVTQHIAKVFDVFTDRGFDARLAGSLGRAAALHADPVSPYRSDGTLRDIDIMLVQREQHEEGLEEAIQDACAAGYPQKTEVIRPNALTFSEGEAALHYRQLSVTIDPRTLSMRTGTLYGMEVPTFDPMTHFHLTAVHGRMRPKDFRSLIAYQRQIANREDMLPDEMFEPFHELYRSIGQQYPMDRRLAHVFWEYHEHIPAPVKTAIQPVLRTIYRYYGRTL